MKAHATLRSAYQAVGPAGEPDTPRRKRRVEAKPVDGLTMEIGGDGIRDLTTTWQLLVKAGLVAPSQISVGGFQVPGHPRSDANAPLPDWVLTIDVRAAPATPFVTLATGDAVADLVDTSIVAAVTDGFGTQTVATARVAWTKFAKGIRRAGGAAELDWRTGETTPSPHSSG